MFDLTLLSLDTGSKILYENSAFICAHRKEIYELALSEKVEILHNQVLTFETDEDMISFASKIATIK